jgi:SSS family solute:Na+ symporter
MYQAEEGYVNGLSAFVIGLIACVAYFFVGASGFIIKKLRQLRVMTIPEFYEIRYSRGVRVLGAVVLTASGVLNMGMFVYISGLFLVMVVGIDPRYLPHAMTFLSAVVLLYTTLGGMVSVVLTDYIQFVIMTIGAAVATYFAVHAVGWDTMVTLLEAEKGAAAFNPIAALHPKYGWSFILWQIFAQLGAAALWPPSTSRALSTDSPATSKKVFAITGLTFMGRAVLPMTWGIAAFVWLTQRGLAGQVGSNLEGMPQFLRAVLPPGVIGLVTAGMLAAFMSTQDSYLLCWSSVIAQDIIAPLSRRSLSPKARILITRIAIAVISVFLVVWGLWFKLPETSWRYMAITGSMYTAGALTVIGLGLYWKRCNTIGAYCGIVLGAILPALFLALSQMDLRLPTVVERFVSSDKLTGLTSYIIALAGTIVGSLVTQKSHPPKRVEPCEEV